MSKSRPTEASCPDDQQAAGMKWINGLLRDNYHSFQQLRDGVVWCRLLNRVYPGSIRMKSVKQRSPSAVDWYANYHLLHATLKKLDISVDISARDLINGQDAEIVRAVHFFLDLYLEKKCRKRQNLHYSPRDKRKGNSKRTTPRLKTQPIVSCFNFIPKCRNFFSSETDKVEYRKFLEDSIEEENGKYEHRNSFPNDQQNSRQENWEFQVQHQQVAVDNEREDDIRQQHMDHFQYYLDRHNIYNSPAAKHEQGHQDKLIKMYFDLAKAELLMERLWLQRRQRRKMRGEQQMNFQ